MTRRGFLGKMFAGLVLLAGGCSGRCSWPVKGSDSGNIRLIFYTDVHARTEWETPQAMFIAADAINTREVDLVIAGGDLITDGFEATAIDVAPRWDAYIKMHKAIHADVYPAIGNHDLVGADPRDGSPPAPNPRSVYLERMGLPRTYYSFNAVGYHFIILDSIEITGDDYRYQGLIWPEEFEWLKRDLAGVNPGTPIVVATHIPLLTSFYAATEGATYTAKRNRVIINNRDVLKLFESHNVVLVLQGHLHVRELIEWQNTSFIVGGAVCAKWWRGPYYGTEEGFNILTLNNNRVEWEYIDYGWTAKRP